MNTTTLDIDQFLNADLFAQPSPASPASSHPSSPEQALLTPPQPTPLAAFPDATDYSLFDEEPKAALIDYDSFLAPGPSALDPAIFNLDLPYPFMNLPHDQMAIDPQLVGTPASTAPVSDFDDDDADDEHPPPPPPPSFTIAPIKVGGHGKARRGTVQSGGVVKKSAASRDKENLISSAFSSTLPSSSPSVSASPKTLPKPPTILKSSSAKKGKAKDDEDEDDDDVPQDWRPSPEVFSKMTSKEKRQLRNKISARNFRVRRKEYISTLEGDIAERDRLLDAIRSELGTTQSENLALRQEIASLKKVLLEGRDSATDLPLLNLPPPAPLPLGNLPAAAATPAGISASALPAITNDAMLSPPSTPPTQHQQLNAMVNTQKDLPSSSPMPRNGHATSAFWGGQHSSILGGAGGITPVHTTLVPEIHVGLWGNAGVAGTKKILGENNSNSGMNMNPLLNLIGAGAAGNAAVADQIRGVEKVNNVTMVPGGLSGFDAFADTNLFTMKSLDAYRMQLWGRMAAQHHAHQVAARQQTPSPTLSASSLSSFYSSSSSSPSSSSSSSHSGLSGHASGLRPAFFSSPILSLKSSSASSSSFGGLSTPPMSPRLSGLSPSNNSNNLEREKEREREAQAAMLAVVASQTLFKKLGNAFWDAFSGGAGSSSSSPSGAGTGNLATKKKWDADKVRKVLEGKAVVRVVDVESPAIPAVASPTISSSTNMANNINSNNSNNNHNNQHSSNNNPGSCVANTKKCCGSVTEILEESMRSLSISKSSSTGGGGGLGGEKEKRN